MRGRFLHSKLPEIIRKHEARFVSSGKFSGKQQSRFDRDSFALFYRYISAAKEQEIGGVSNINMQSGASQKPIEKVLMNYINSSKLNMSGIEKAISDFDTYLFQHAAQLDDIIIRAGQKGKPVAPTLLHWMWHLALFTKNTKQPAGNYWRFVENLVVSLSVMDRFPSRFTVPNSSPVVQVTLRLGGVTHLSRLCDALEVDLIGGNRKKSRKLVKGYHVSHVVPFATHGEGETFIEPAPANLIRGAKIAKTHLGQLAFTG